MSLLVHPSIETTLETLQRSLPQALLLSGDSGVGLATIARHIADDSLETYIEPTNKDGEVDRVNGSISINEIRRIYETTRGKSPHDRAIIIDDIDRMTLQAQNAFLKLLEEPPAGVRFIATTHSVKSILPTILSRMQTVHIPQITEGQTDQQLRGSRVTDDQKKRLKYMAVGRPAEMRRLLDDAVYRKREEKLYGAARAFVGGTSYQKLLMVQTIKTRTDALRFTTTCIAIMRSALAHNATSTLVSNINRMSTAHERIARNGNIKLQLLRTCL